MKISIELPDDIAKKLEKESKDMGFETAEEFIEYIIIDHFSDNSKISDDEMKERLRSLGYME